MFYSSYYHFDENKLYIFDDKKGIVKYNYSPYCYIKTDEETEYRTIFGDKVKQVRATKEYKTSPNAFEVDVSPTLRYLVDNYYNDDSIVQNRIMIIDIETETVGDIETTVRGENTILSIATYIDGNYSTFILDPEKRFINPKNGRNYYCFDDEKEMLKRFVLYLRKTAKPTIITGWNSYKFDTPTIYNRLKVLFGEKVANKLSPIGLVIDKTIGLNHRNEFYEGKSIIGINHLDYIILYKKYSQDSNYFDEEAIKEATAGKEFFDFPRLHFTLTTEQSKAINDAPMPKIIIAGSGMSNGGRILHHELRYLPDPNTTILFIGYQAQGTMGRAILDGAKVVRIMGEEIPVRCKMATISGYSAHADQPLLLQWISPMRRSLKKVFLVHGDMDQMEPFAQKLRDEFALDAVIPAYGLKITL